MEITAEVAYNIVDFIYQQSGYHSIVCDKSARIIADSARERDGVVHLGSQKILSGHEDEATVTAEEAAQSGGTSKEGFSIAIKHGAEKIGSFGIAGPLEIVTPIARVAAGMGGPD